jgi:hypothetical protein
MTRHKRVHAHDHSRRSINQRAGPSTLNSSQLCHPRTTDIYLEPEEITIFMVLHPNSSILCPPSKRVYANLCLQEETIK